jgi:hypothetical protein
MVPNRKTYVCCSEVSMAYIMSVYVLQELVSFLQRQDGVSSGSKQPLHTRFLTAKPGQIHGQTKKVSSI